MKTFNVPEFYRSPIITKLKQYRKAQDPRKQSNAPTVLDFGPVKYYIARHFGFCYGVENAIEIAFKAINENPGKRIFLLSEMIHNQDVNKDLLERGVRFLHDTFGKEILPVENLTKEDIVIIPAFGAPLSITQRLNDMGIETQKYNTTCPFVERVWKKSEQIGKTKHTIIIHGKYLHEETRSTFSRSILNSAAVVVKDMREAIQLGQYILGKRSQTEFEKEFEGKFSTDFSISKDFDKVGVINQTTMLATETQAIADYFKQLMKEKYGKEEFNNHFADTRDTLCYATNENQDATLGLLETDADLAIVVGGYNSSNTSHLVELLERKFPTYFISSAKEIEDEKSINHFDYPNKKRINTANFLNNKKEIKVILTSGASCPDSLLEEVIIKLNSFYRNIKPINEALSFVEQN